MSLVICRECQHEISDRANACPQCGFPNSGQKTPAALPAMQKQGPSVALPREIAVQDGAEKPETFETRPKTGREKSGAAQNLNRPHSRLREIISKQVAYGFLFATCGIMSVVDGVFSLSLLEDVPNVGYLSGNLLGALAAFVAGYASFLHGHEILKTSFSRFKNISTFKLVAYGTAVAFAAIFAGVLIGLTFTAVRSAAHTGRQSVEYDQGFKDAREAAQQFKAAHPHEPVGPSLLLDAKEISETRENTSYNAGFSAGLVEEASH